MLTHGVPFARHNDDGLTKLLLHPKTFLDDFDQFGCFATDLLGLKFP